MKPEQLKMARHALGLPNEGRRSYRNRYTVGKGTTQEAEWLDLVEQGMAVHAHEGITLNTYYLTEAGATAALQSIETLCPEDFPTATANASIGVKDAGFFRGEVEARMATEGRASRGHRRGAG